MSNSRRVFPRQTSPSVNVGTASNSSLRHLYFILVEIVFIKMILEVRKNIKLHLPDPRHF